MQPHTAPSGSERAAARRDLAIVVLVTISVALLSVGFEISETIYTLTRQWEHRQLDELVPVLFALALCLAWFSWRRYRDASAELARRRTAEERLANLLRENRRLAQQVIQVQEAERKELARELHDELGQYLNAIKTDAVRIQERTEESAPQIARTASAIIRHSDRLHSTVRDLIRQLRPVGLDDLGLRAALEHYLDDLQQRQPNLRILASLEGDLDSLDERISLALYRMTQESMTNVCRHASADSVDIRIARVASPREPDEILFSIVDNGRGAQLNGPPSGLGLVGMRERVEMLGGELHIDSGPDRGFSIRARIPVSEIEAAA